MLHTVAVPLTMEIINRTLRSACGTQAYHIVEKLMDAGYDAWWVGGCVRDMLLDEIPADIDIATSAPPRKVCRTFAKTDESNARYGAVLVSEHGHVFEVTTFRKDHSAGDGRHPESVKFTLDKAEDAQRRDFTVNALYWNPITREFYDPHGGERDLREHLIRFIGDPVERIRQDALRMLRAVRFRALIGGQYHPDTFDALHTCARQIMILSGMRRFTELTKMLMGPNPDRAFEDLWETDIIEDLMPELHACKGVAQPKAPHKEGDVWDHTMQALRSFTTDHGADARWAALLHDIGKPETFAIDDDRIRFNEHASVGGSLAQKALNRLQCPARQRDKIVWLVKHHMMMGTFRELDDERKGNWYYHPWFIELLQIFWLDIAATTPSDFSFYEEIIADYNRYLDAHPLPPRQLLDGNDVMELLGLPPGEKVGKILHSLYAAQLRGEVSTKEEARAFILSHCTDGQTEQSEA